MTILGAYNWITVEATCPVCARSTALRCQTHVASSYAGDGTGRFFDREYRLGDTMAWWAEQDARHANWSQHSRGIGDNWSCIDEACDASCSACGSALCVVLRFRELVIESVVSISRAEEWPEGHPR